MDVLCNGRYHEGTSWHSQTLNTKDTNPHRISLILRELSWESLFSRNIIVDHFRLIANACKKKIRCGTAERRSHPPNPAIGTSYSQWSGVFSLSPLQCFFSGIYSASVAVFHPVKKLYFCVHDTQAVCAFEGRHGSVHLLGSTQSYTCFHEGVGTQWVAVLTDSSRDFLTFCPWHLCPL